MNMTTLTTIPQIPHVGELWLHNIDGHGVTVTGVFEDGDETSVAFGDFNSTLDEVSLKRFQESYSKYRL